MTQYLANAVNFGPSRVSKLMAGISCAILMSCDSPAATVIPVDVEPAIECSDTAEEAPVVGCPCTNQPGAVPYCCTRASGGDVGWQCGGLFWYIYSLPSCDGNPATCPTCPLCPEAWEPDR